MNVERKKRFSALVIILSYLLFGLFGQSGMVLCVRNDGLLKLEMSNPDGSCINSDHQVTGNCSTSAQSQDSVEAGVTCDGCIDISLSVDGLQGSRQNVQVVLSMDTPQSWSVLSPDGQDENLARLEFPPENPDRNSLIAGRCLRSVVLLI